MTALPDQVGSESGPSRGEDSSGVPTDQKDRRSGPWSCPSGQLPEDAPADPMGHFGVTSDRHLSSSFPEMGRDSDDDDNNGRTDKSEKVDDDDGPAGGSGAEAARVADSDAVTIRTVCGESADVLSEGSADGRQSAQLSRSATSLNILEGDSNVSKVTTEDVVRTSNPRLDGSSGCKSTCNEVIGCDPVCPHVEAVSMENLDQGLAGSGRGEGKDGCTEGSTDGRCCRQLSRSSSASPICRQAIGGDLDVPDDFRQCFKAEMGRPFDEEVAYGHLEADRHQQIIHDVSNGSEAEAVVRGDSGTAEPLCKDCLDPFNARSSLVQGQWKLSRSMSSSPTSCAVPVAAKASSTDLQLELGKISGRPSVAANSSSSIGPYQGGSFAERSGHHDDHVAPSPYLLTSPKASCESISLSQPKSQQPPLQSQASPPTLPLQQKSYDYLLKVLLVGDSDVGKQEIISELEDGTTDSPFCSSSGAAFKTTIILIDGKRVKLQLWDTSGQGRFCTIIRSYSRGAQGILLVYDITNKWSFEGIDRWLHEVDQHAPGIPKVLVGNRLHLAFKRQVDSHEAEEYAERNSMGFFEVSPLANFNISETFVELARMALRRNGMERLWKSNKVSSLYELCAHTIVNRTTVYGIDRLPIPNSVKQNLKSYSVTNYSINQANKKLLRRPGGGGLAGCGSGGRRDNGRCQSLVSSIGGQFVSSLSLRRNKHRLRKGPLINTPADAANVTCGGGHGGADRKSCVIS